MSLLHRSIPVFFDTLEDRRLLSITAINDGQSFTQPIDATILPADTSPNDGTPTDPSDGGGDGTVVDGGNSDGGNDGIVDDGSAGDPGTMDDGSSSPGCGVIEPTDTNTGDGTDPTDGQLPGGPVDAADGGPIMYAFGGAHATQSRHQRHVVHARHARAMARDAKAHRGVFASSAAAALWFHRHA